VPRRHGFIDGQRGYEQPSLRRCFTSRDWRATPLLLSRLLRCWHQRCCRRVQSARPGRELIGVGTSTTSPITAAVDISSTGRNIVEVAPRMRHDQGPLTTSRAAFQFQACMHTACAADPGEHENACGNPRDASPHHDRHDHLHRRPEAPASSVPRRGGPWRAGAEAALFRRARLGRRAPQRATGGRQLRS
jgi:hypothetical protein